MSVIGLPISPGTPSASVVNVGAVITKAMTKLPGGLPRAQFVTWFNEIMRDVLIQPRNWFFLEEPITLTITGNRVLLPATMSYPVAIVVGNPELVLTNNDLLTATEAARIDYGAEGIGFTLTPSGVITFHPALTGTATITGAHDITIDYADGGDTLFPLAFEPLFVTGLRMHYYDQTKDGRYTKENLLYQVTLSNIKAWDNRRKGTPRYNHKGMIR